MHDFAFLCRFPASASDSKRQYHYGFLWRALMISLVAHAVFLLQPGFGGGSAQTAGTKSLIALLKPRVEAGSDNTVKSALGPSVSHQAQKDQAATAKVSAFARNPQHTIVDAEDSRSDNTAATTTLKVPATPGNGDIDFSEGKKSYLFAIAAEARRIKKYPSRAFAAGFTGTAEIRVAVTAGGNVEPPQLLSSSGHAEIDDAAVSLVGTALKRTPVPDNLRDRTFDFVLPVSFRINDE